MHNPRLIILEQLDPLANHRDARRRRFTVNVPTKGRLEGTMCYGRPMLVYQ